MRKDGTPKIQNDEWLFERSAGGDRKAFEHLYDRYRDKLVWFARGFTRDHEVAEDIVQEVFITVIEKPGAFDGSKRFSTWIYTVTGNRCRNLIRDENNRKRILEDLAGAGYQSGHDEVFDRKLLRQRVQTAISQLSPKEQQLCHLRFEEEQNIKNIAGIMSMPEGSVKSGLFHLLRKIGKQLKEFSDAKR